MSYTQIFTDRDSYLELIREEIRRNNAELDEKLKNTLAGLAPEPQEQEHQETPPCD